MKGFVKNFKNKKNDMNEFRRVRYTGKYCQLVSMYLNPKEDIGLEVHPDTDQFFSIINGSGEVVIDETNYQVESGDFIVVPAGAKHNVTNSSEKDPLFIITLYSPPHHKDGVVHQSKKEAENDDEEYDGDTTEP